MALAFASLTSYPPTSTTAAATNAGGAVWAYPAGIVANDALILCAVNNDPGGGSGLSGTSFALPTGWTAMESQPGILSDTGAYLYEKTAAGTESGTNITLRPSATALVCAAILRYSGNDHTSPFGDTASAISTSTATGSPAKGTLSPVPALIDMVTRMFGWAQNSAATGVAATIPTAAGTAGWSTRLNVFTNVGSSFNCGLAILDKPGGTDNFTVTASVASAWMVGDAAIKSAPTLSARPANISQAVKRAAYY